MEQEAERHVVTFHDLSGKPVGDTWAVLDGRWQPIPPSVAVKMTMPEAPAETADQITRGEIIALFRLAGINSAIDLWAGPAPEAWAKMEEPPVMDGDDPMGLKFEVSCDAYVLKADGTIER